MTIASLMRKLSSHGVVELTVRLHGYDALHLWTAALHNRGGVVASRDGYSPREALKALEQAVAK